MEGATKQDIEDARSGKYGTNSLSAVVYLRNVRERSDRIRRVVEGSTPPPHYATTGPVRAFALKRIGKRVRQWFGGKKESTPVSEQEVTQGKKYNISTGTMKSIIATVAMLTALAGGIMGKEILIDEQSITAAAETLYQAYLGVMAVVAAVTFVLRFVQNITKNWGRITEHGVKVSGPNLDVAFDFAPKDESL